MKIWLLRRRYAPGGGAERYTQRLAARLHRMGHDVWIAAEQWPESPEEEYHLQKISSHGLAPFFRACAKQGVGKEESLVFSLERTPRQQIFRAGDGVHSCWLKRRGRFQSRVSRIWTSWSRKHQTVLEMERRTLTPEGSDWIIANSTMVKKEILENSPYPEERIRVIHSGVDLDHFRPCPNEGRKEELRERFGLPVGVAVWCFVGSGFERKGLLWAIQIAAALRKEGVHLLVLGRGSRGRFIQAAMGLGLEERLVFAPEGTESMDVFHASDAFILPTIYDPCSNATLEAAACGLRVITTPGNGASEWTEGPLLEDPTRVGECVEKCRAFTRPLKIEKEALALLRARLDEKPCWDATLDLISEAAKGMGTSALAI